MNHKNTIGYEIKTLDNLFFRNLLSYEISQNNMDEVTVMHGWILSFLHENENQNIYQKDIETEFSIARSTVTCIVKLMEKKGYICRENVARDARLKKLVLTEKGRRINEQHRDDIDILEERCKRDITPEHLEIFRKVAEQLKQNLEEDIASNLSKKEHKEE